MIGNTQQGWRRALLGGGALAAVLTVSAATTARKAGAEAAPRARSDYYRLPLTFEPNVGQTDPRVRFLSRGEGYTLFLAADEAVLSLGGGSREKVPAAGREVRVPAEAETVRMRFAGGNPAAPSSGVERLPGVVNYLKGNDRAKWRTGVPTFAKVRYAEVYDGIDVVYYGNQRKLEYDFVLRPGADPRRIRLDFDGVRDLSISAEGDLVLRTGKGELVQRKPVIFQEKDGKREPVDGRYVLLSGKHDGQPLVGISVAGYDAARPLVIDPVMEYGTYLGGNDWDTVYGLTVDAAGSAYVTGYTYSTDFPVATPFQSTIRPSGPDFQLADVFVTKFNPAGSALVYSTYLGGSDDEGGWDITVDAAGSPYVIGHTFSNDFPQVSPVQPRGGFSDAFIAKLSGGGDALLFSTYVGGNDFERGMSIALGPDGAIFGVGDTRSPNFPTTPNAFQSQLNGGNNEFDADAYVVKINREGTQYVYSTLLGGESYEEGNNIAVDAQGSAYVVGNTDSTAFPVRHAIQGALAGRRDGYVAKLSPDGTTLVYATYLGGSNDDSGVQSDFARGVALDANGAVYVVGTASSQDFPLVNPLRDVVVGRSEAFLTRINPAGNAFDFSTFLGGSGIEWGQDVALGPGGAIYVCGITYSRDFPIRNAPQAVHGGVYDGFAMKLRADGQEIVYSTFLGGASIEEADSIAVHPDGAAYIGGFTDSSNFPTANPFQATRRSPNAVDGFVVKLGAVVEAPAAPSNLTVGTVTQTQVPLTWTDNSTTESIFTIERKSGTGDWEVVGAVAQDVTTFTDTDRTPGTSYSYRVRASGAGGESASSNEVTATTLPNPPPAPTGLTALPALPGVIVLVWTEVSTADGYRIERSTDGTNFTEIGTAGDDTFSDPVTPNVTYSYRVRAFNAGGNSDYSSVVTGQSLLGISLVTVAPTAVSGGRSATGKIVLSAPAPAGGVRVSVTSSNRTASVPVQVTVPAGQSAVRFTINTSRPRRTTQATITATLDETSDSATLTIKRAPQRRRR